MIRPLFQRTKEWEGRRERREVRKPAWALRAVSADIKRHSTPEDKRDIPGSIAIGTCSFMRLVSIKPFVLFLWILLHVMTGGPRAGTIDQLGRQVAVPSDPRRVVALAPSITEIVFALDRQDRLAGATRFSDYPPEAASLPKVGSYIHLDLERIVALSPDLCIAVKDGNPKAVVDRLEMLDIPVYAVNPVDLASVNDTIVEIGGLLQAESQAVTIVAGLSERIATVRAKVATVTRHPRVFFQIGVSPIVAVGSGTFIHELIVMAGGENATAGPVPYPRLSREQVIALAPDIIIITSMARSARIERVKADWERWPDIPAIQKDRIHLVDSDIFDRASPRLIDALEQLAVLIHPQFDRTNP